MRGRIKNAIIIVNLQLYVTIVIALAVVGANLPFINQRLFALIPLPWAVKPFSLRAGEMLVGYGAVIGMAYMFEAHLGKVAQQGWEHYAVTLCLFVVAAFPGFVWCYLIKRGR